MENKQNVYRGMMNGVSDRAVILLDRDGNIREWSRGAELIYGYSAGEVLGKHIGILHTPEDVTEGLSSREFASSSASGCFEAEGWRVTKSGKRFWSGVVVTPFGEPDAFVGFLKVGRDLTREREREQSLQRARDEIRELSTPVIRLWDNILALPIIGTLDSMRTLRLTENLLEKIRTEEAGIVIMDISGVSAIDTQVAQYLLKTIQAARLMGADTILSGLRPETAQSMVQLGIELGKIKSRSTLHDALKLAFSMGHADVSDLSFSGGAP